MGQAKEREQPVMECIYCGSQERLSDEHIIPYGLSGDLVLKKASCHECAKSTSQLEQQLLRGHWWSYRQFLGLKSRRSQENLPNLTVTVKHELKGNRAAELPLIKNTVAIIFDFDPPSILNGEIRSDIPNAPRAYMKLLGPFPDSVLMNGEPYKLALDEQLEIPINFDASELCRFLAKIAHSYAISKRGLHICEKYFLPEIVLGKVEGALTYVGCARSPFLVGKLPGSGIHALMDRINGSFLTVYIQLFRDAGDPPPIYEVVVGRVAKRSVSM
jgi:hypothetical protein